MKERPFKYVNQYYGVNACIGRRVVAYGEPAVIVKDFGNHIGIVLDSNPQSAPEPYHPVDGIEYGEIIDYQPRKLNFRKEIGKRKYQEYLDADYGGSFSEWLGIETPYVEYDHKGQCRMCRIGNYWKISISGDWCRTKKAAKESYKKALQRTLKGKS